MPACGGSGLAAACRRRRHRHRGRRPGRRAGRAPARPQGGGAEQGRPTPRRSTRRAASPWCCRDTDDSIEAHVADTLAAGAGLCDPDAVRSIVADGYRAVVELVDDGARFDEAEPGRWSLTREGGHSRRRIIHAGGDATGAEVQRALDHAAATLDIRRNHVALQILHDRRRGDGRAGAQRGRPRRRARARRSSWRRAGSAICTRRPPIPEGSTGDGVALALWAGVPVSDIEFIQFHPTMLFDGHAGGRRPLITEARPRRGRRFCSTRRAIRSPRACTRWATWRRATWSPRPSTRGCRATGDPCVYLDARGIDRLRAPVPDGHGGLPGGGHRPDAPTDSGGAGRALQLRRRGDRRARPHRASRVVRRGRGGAHRYARREPAGVQQPAGGPGGRRPRRQGGGRSTPSTPGHARAELVSVATRGLRCRAGSCSGRCPAYASVVRDADGLQQAGAGTRGGRSARPRLPGQLRGRRADRDRPRRHRCCAGAATRSAAAITAPTSRTPTRRWRTARCSQPRPAADGAQRRRADRSSQGHRPRPGGRPALRAGRDHAGDGARRCEHDGVDGRPASRA